MNQGILSVQSGVVDKDLLVHFDEPNGRPRWTYVYTSENQITAFANLTPCDPLEGKPCFQIGYAVPKDYRGKGLAKKIAAAAMVELSNGFERHGDAQFFIEASVEIGNDASHAVARAIFGESVQDGEDEKTGEKLKLYRKSFGI